MLLNFETALALYDPASVAAVEAWFEAQLPDCLAGAKPARLPRRMAEATFRLGAPIL
jgi:cardiolipin synthase